MGVIKRTFLGALVICAIASASFAQDEADLWKFSVSVAGEGSDNRDSTPEGESNVDLFLKLKLDLNMDWESSMLDFFYEPAYRYRSDPSELQNDTELQHALGLIARRDLGTIDLRAHERFNYTDDPSIQQTGSTLRRDSSFMLNNLNLGARFLLTDVSDIDLSLRNTIKRYDDDERAVQSDEDSTSADLAFWRRMDEISAYAILGASVFNYDDTTLERGFDRVMAGVGVEKAFSRDLSGGVRVGYTSITYDDDTLSDDSSPFIRASVVSKMTAVSRVTGIVGYTLRDSDIYPFSSQESSMISLKWDWDTTPLLGLGLYGMYRLGSYDADTVSNDVANKDLISDGDETTIVLQGEVKYKVNETTSIMLAQRWEDVDSDVTGSSSYTRNSTRLSLAKQF